MVDPVAPAALNCARYSEMVLAALGATGQIDEFLWVNSHALDLPYAHGLTLGGPTAAREQMQAIKALVNSRPDEYRTVIADSWSNLDLDRLGFRVLFTDPWFVRQPGGTDARRSPDGLVIRQVDSPQLLAEFEVGDARAFHGNQVAVPDVPGWHYAPALLDDPRVTIHAGLVDGKLVAGVIAFDDGESVGLYTLITLPEARRRGYGDAMIQAAVTTAPDLPVSTNPSELSQRLFARAGFRQVGRRTIWIHESDMARSPAP